MDELIRPLFRTETPEPGGLFHRQQIEGITGLSGMRLREFWRDRLVYVRDIRNTGANAWNLSTRGDVAVFVILSQLRDMAGVNADVLRAASIALYGWRVPEQESKPWYPAMHAMYGAATSPPSMWLLRLRFAVNDQTGQRDITGYCYPEANPPRLAIDPRDPWQPAGDLHFIITPPLVRLVAAFKKFAGTAPKLDA